MLPAAPVDATNPQWPSDAIGQITAIRRALLSGARNVASLKTAFDGTRPDLLLRRLETLVLLGEVEHHPPKMYMLARGGALSAV